MPTDRPTDGRWRRVDASMTLLTEVYNNPLDPSYQAAAEQRLAGAAPHRRFTQVVLTAIAIALGFGLAIATAQLRGPTGSAREVRVALETQIQARTASNLVATEEITALNLQISALQDVFLAATDPRLDWYRQLDAANIGATTVAGPGMIVTLTDGDVTAPSLVRDSDLQFVVSALWAAGAEAISVSDIRLAATTAIRNAGDAVLVDLTPVLGPTFVIRAIGDPWQMWNAWESSQAPAYLTLLRTELGITSAVERSTDLTLPGATVRGLRYAEVLSEAS